MGDGELHKGHRQRMLKKYLENGIKCFEEHEILEIVLFGIFTRCNTNEISHRLISKFGALEKVFEAKLGELKDVSGVGDAAAAMICFLGDFFRLLNAAKPKNVSLSSAESIIKYCRSLYPSSASRETVFALFLDSDYTLISQSEIERGGTNYANIDMRRLLKDALNSDCEKVILVHNHPSGSSLVSSADINATRELARTLKIMNIALTDHIIVCGDAGHSLRAMEIMKDVWN